MPRLQKRFLLLDEPTVDNAVVTDSGSLIPRLGSGQQELLRWLALLSMVVDHVGVIFVPPEFATPFRTGVDSGIVCLKAKK